jgi:hypothetical protein
MGLNDEGSIMSARSVPRSVQVGHTAADLEKRELRLQADRRARKQAKKALKKSQVSVAFLRDNYKILTSQENADVQPGTEPTIAQVEPAAPQSMFEMAAARRHLFPLQGSTDSAPKTMFELAAERQASWLAIAAANRQGSADYNALHNRGSLVAHVDTYREVDERYLVEPLVPFRAPGSARPSPSQTPRQTLPAEIVDTMDSAALKEKYHPLVPVIDKPIERANAEKRALRQLARARHRAAIRQARRASPDVSRPVSHI